MEHMEERGIKKYIRKGIHIIYQVISTAVIFVGGILALLYLSGIRLYYVQSGSMGELLPLESVCFVSTYSSFENIEAGDVISFRVSDDMKVAHRAICVTDEGIYTQGDMNEIPDPDPVTKENYIGKTVFALPDTGGILQFFHTLHGKIAVGSGLLLLLLLGRYYHPESD
jgi:signal peptidase